MGRGSRRRPGPPSARGSVPRRPEAHPTAAPPTIRLKTIPCCQCLKYTPRPKIKGPRGTAGDQDSSLVLGVGIFGRSWWQVVGPFPGCAARRGYRWAGTLLPPLREGQGATAKLRLAAPSQKPPPARRSRLRARHWDGTRMVPGWPGFKPAWTEGVEIIFSHGKMKMRWRLGGQHDSDCGPGAPGSGMPPSCAASAVPTCAMRTACTAASCSKSLSTSSTRTGACFTSAKWTLKKGGREGVKANKPPDQGGHPKTTAGPGAGGSGAGMDSDSLRGLLHQPALVLGVELLQVPQLDAALLAPRPLPQPLQARLQPHGRWEVSGRDGRLAGETGGGRLTGCGHPAKQPQGRDHSQASGIPGRCCSPPSPKSTLGSRAKLPPTFPWERERVPLPRGDDLWLKPNTLAIPGARRAPSGAEGLPHPPPR